MKKLFISSFIFRLILLIWGNVQHHLTNVPYTDIDYKVFMDASKLVHIGKSPYLRATYRYTPLLAHILRMLSDQVSVLVFIAFDILTGVLLILYLNNPLVVESWLLNPFVMVISTRGNCESILTFLSVLVLLLLQKNQLGLCAFVLGFAVHFKLYPVIYLVPICTRLQRQSFLAGCCQFLIVTISSFLIFTGSMYTMYGFEYLDHAFIYHVIRSDHRHNFSPYFMLMTLINQKTQLVLFKYIPFVFQMGLVLVLGYKYALVNLPLAMFLQTFTFVSFNKVLTSQYFMWWMCYLPFVLQVFAQSKRLDVFFKWIALWVVAQGIWLYYAYLLEFKGQNTFMQLFYSGLGLFFVHIGIVVQCIYTFHQSQLLTRILKSQ